MASDVPETGMLSTQQQHWAPLNLSQTLRISPADAMASSNPEIAIFILSVIRDSEIAIPLGHRLGQGRPEPTTMFLARRFLAMKHLSTMSISFWTHLTCPRKRFSY